MTLAGCLSGPVQPPVIPGWTQKVLEQRQQISSTKRGVNMLRFCFGIERIHLFFLLNLSPKYSVLCEMTFPCV